MTRMRLLAGALAIAAVIPAAAQAQSLPFRAGQWGAEFQSGDLTTAGAMRFFSPRTALVLNVGILNIETEEEVTTTGGGSGTESENALSLYAARLGFRTYTPIAHRVAGFWTVGVELARGSQEQFVPSPFGGGVQVEQTETQIGAFGQLGADYHITNNIAVGMAFDLVFARVTGEEKDPQNTIDISGHRFSAALTPVRFSIFF